MKILVVEDDRTTAHFLHQGLTEEGYVVDLVQDGTSADEAVHAQTYDAILLDVMLPDEDGFSLCRRWRERGLDTPILFLTARDGLTDRVQGLDLGADDYLVKPFAFQELLARLRARLRRGAQAPLEEALAVGPLSLNPSARQVFCEGKELSLTTREYLILELLARHAGRVVSRARLWEQVWETGREPNSNVVDVYVGYLRSKLGSARSQLRTVRGAGYMLCPQ